MQSDKSAQNMTQLIENLDAITHSTRVMKDEFSKKAKILLSQMAELSKSISDSLINENPAKQSAIDEQRKINLKRKYTTLEQIKECAKLKMYHHTPPQIADKMQCTERYIKMLLECSGYPQKLLNMLDKNIIAVNTLIWCVGKYKVHDAHERLAEIIEWTKKKNDIRKNKFIITKGIVERYEKENI